MDMTNLKNNMRMNKKKSLYEAPTTDILVVRFEGALLQTSTLSSKGTELMTIDSEEDF